MTMNESRNRFFFPAFVILFAIAFFRSMSKGRLSGFLLEQGLVLLVVGAVVGTFVWVDRFLRKGHSTEWMTRYYKWVFGVIGAAGVIFFATCLGGSVWRRSVKASSEWPRWLSFLLHWLSAPLLVWTCSSEKGGVNNG